MQLFNTLSRKKENFKPQESGKVSLYSCGPTVYDYLHIGNWATYVRWDILNRVLRNSGYEVHWVMNITDVGHLTSDADEGEDKLEKGARREGKSAWEVADFYTQDFLRGLKFLNIEMGEHGKLVKATDHIDQQIELIQKLDNKEFTYTTSDGVYFDTSKLTDYGKLAQLDISGLKAGARVATGEKRSSTDFALWKFSPKNQKRDMEWDSPWGKGFPGWHIECSAMSMEYLGETLDIHTGGIDHIPVHHTNEIAQSEAATGKQFVNYWLHSNFLLIDDQKIAKSLGNGIRLQDVVEKGFSAADFRMLVLQSHYRTEAGFTWEILESASARLRRWQAAASRRWQPTSHSKPVDFSLAGQQLRAALQDDLNTAQALAVIDRILDEVLNEGVATSELVALTEFLEHIEQLLGIVLFDDDITEDQKKLITTRQAAREHKDWKKSDNLRAQLEKQGITVKDTAEGQIWNRL